MSPTALDRMADDFPHGTIEGERAGCVASDCPAVPLTCAEIGGHYRRDFRFKKLYQSGIRGQELHEAFEPVAAADKQRTATPKPGPRPRAGRDWSSRKEAVLERAAENAADSAALETPLGANFRTAPQDEKDRRLIAAVAAGLSWATIGQEIGTTPGAVAMMHKAALRRTEATTQPVPNEETAAAVEDAAADAAEPEARLEQGPHPEPEVTDHTPVPAALVTERFGVPPVTVADIPGPQIARMWVVLDRNKHVVLATPDTDTATAAFAAEWAAQMDAES